MSTVRLIAVKRPIGKGRVDWHERDRELCERLSMVYEQLRS